MKKELTVETVELEQCPHGHNPNTTLRDPCPGPPPSAEPSSRPSETEEHTRFDMASSTDAAFVEDVDMDRELRARAGGSSKSHKSGATSPGPDSDNEDAPLLNITRDGYGSSGGDSDDNEEEQWNGDADFRGLPWWKRPSVRASRPMHRHMES